MPQLLEKSASRAAVKTMDGQKFMVTLPDGTKATLPSTCNMYLNEGR